MGAKLKVISLLRPCKQTFNSPGYSKMGVPYIVCVESTRGGCNDENTGKLAAEKASGSDTLK